MATKLCGTLYIWLKVYGYSGSSIFASKEVAAILLSEATLTEISHMAAGVLHIFMRVISRRIVNAVPILPSATIIFKLRTLVGLGVSETAVAKPVYVIARYKGSSDRGLPVLVIEAALIKA